MTTTETTVDDHVDDALRLLEVDRLEQAAKRALSCELMPCNNAASWLLTVKPCGCKRVACDACRAATQDAYDELHQFAPSDSHIIHRACGTHYLLSDAAFTATPI